MKNTGSWEIDKRPVKKNEIILHPRILGQIHETENGIDRNYLFFGSFGNGKTTKGKSIFSLYYHHKGSKLYLDASKTKPEHIRKVVDEFLGRARIGKSIIFIDEINRLHKNGQEQLASSMEKSVNTNFILTSNTLSLEGALFNRVMANVVTFDLTKKELHEMKSAICAYYKNISVKPVEDGVVEYLFKTYKECLRNGIQHLQTLNDTKEARITMSDVKFGDNMSPLLRAVFCSKSGKAIFEELEEYGVERASRCFDEFITGARKLGMVEGARIMCMDTMDAIGSLSHIYETASRKVVIMGILFEMNKILKAYPQRNVFRTKVIASMAEKDRTYYD